MNGMRNGTRWTAPGRAAKKARQGVRYHALEGLGGAGSRDHGAACRPATLGEVMFRGNMVMKGYLKNPDGHRAGLCRRLVSFRRSGGDG